MRNSTLLFLIERDSSNTITRICLAMKKRGFGAGRWNGVGGKVDESEIILQAAKRETKEEINVDVKDCTEVAQLTFTFPNNPDWNQLVTVYFCNSWQGEPQESEEMNPEWFAVEKIPYSEMWPDDIFWLPEVISGKYIKAQFSFGEGDVILEQKIETV